jgi:hypothetical protein
MRRTETATGNTGAVCSADQMSTLLSSASNSSATATAASSQPSGAELQNALLQVEAFDIFGGDDDDYDNSEDDSSDDSEIRDTYSL